MRKLNIYILVIVLASLVYAVSVEISNFSNSSSSENITFTAKENITRYLLIPNASYVSNLTIELDSALENGSLYDALSIYNFDDGNDTKRNSTLARFLNTFHRSGDGAAGDYVNFSQGYYANTSLQYNINNFTNFSISVWVRPAVSNGLRIIYAYNELASNGRYMLFLNDGKLALQSADGTGTFYTSEIGPVNDSWHNFVVVHNTSHDTIYMNGEYLNASASANPTVGTANTFYVAQHPSDSFRFLGDIDELYIYKRELNFSEVQKLNRTYKDAPQYLGYNEGLIDNIIRNVTYYVDGNLDNSINVPLDDKTISFNIGLINDAILKNCNATSFNCSVPITFESVEAGILKYSNINLTYGFGVDNCTNSFGIPSNATALNVSFFNQLGAPFTLDYSSFIEYGPNGNNNFSFANSGNNFTICIYPNYATISSDILVEYKNQSYNTLDTLLNNITQRIDLYSQDDTTQVTFSVIDFSDDPVEDAYIHIMRWNPDSNSYSTTEILRTDATGEAVGSIVLSTVFYKFIVTVDGETKLIEPSGPGTKHYTTTKTFRISLDTETWYDNLDTTNDATTFLNFTNSTNSFVYTWTNVAGTAIDGCLKVIQTNFSGTATLFDRCTSSASSSIVHQITPNNGTTYVGTGYFIFNGDVFVTDTKEVTFARGHEPFGVDKSFALYMAFILILALTLTGVPYPAVSFVLFSAGLVLSITVGLWQISMGIVSAIIILGAIHLIRSGKT